MEKIMNTVSINASSKNGFVVDTVFRAGCIVVAGALRRSRLPTPALFAFGLLQGALSTTAMEVIKLAERKLVRKGWMSIDQTNSKTIAVANFILSQAISIGLTYLAVNSLAVVGFSLLYDMNPPSITPYDAGSVFCIVSQGTLVNLFLKSMKDLYNSLRITGR